MSRCVWIHLMPHPIFFFFFSIFLSSCLTRTCQVESVPVWGSIGCERRKAERRQGGETPRHNGSLHGVQQPPVSRLNSRRKGRLFLTPEQPGFKYWRRIMGNECTNVCVINYGQLYSFELLSLQGHFKILLEKRKMLLVCRLNTSVWLCLTEKERKVALFFPFSYHWLFSEAVCFHKL